MNSGPRDTDASADRPSNATPDGISRRRTVEFDPDGDRKLGTLVVETVAEVAGIDPVATERPLYGTLDPDALDALFGPRVNGEARPGGRVEFEMAGCAVTVHGEGRVEVTGRPAAAANRRARRRG